MKLYDFDGMFDEKLSQYVAKNPKRYTEEEWENVIPALYKKFGDTIIKSLQKTPREYYGGMSDEELVKCLQAHLKKGVPVSEFLCETLESRGATKLLIPLLDGTDEEREYAMRLLGSHDEVIKKYLEILISSDNADLKDKCAELIKEKADLVAADAVGYYNKGTEREYMLEIMSRTVIKNEEIFKILLNAFRADDENLDMHASYLASYGDERALPYLLDKIDEEGISYVDFRELKFAIEALGGEYDKERDFSDDPYFNLIKSHNPVEDIFGNLGKK